MLNHQKFYIARKRLSYSERHKSAQVKKNKKTVAQQSTEILSAHSLYLKTELGCRWHKILKDAKWKCVKSSEDLFAVYKKGNCRIWVNRKWEWFYQNEKRTREVKWATILKKFHHKVAVI